MHNKAGAQKRRNRLVIRDRDYTAVSIVKGTSVIAHDITRYIEKLCRAGSYDMKRCETSDALMRFVYVEVDALVY